MKNKNLLERLSANVSSDVQVRRYSLSDMISESYKAYYGATKDSRLQRLAESHLNDVRDNPTDIERLSEQLCYLKELVRMQESGEIKDITVEKRKPAKEALKESENCSLKDTKPSKKDLEETEDPKETIDEDDTPELTEEEVEELAKHLEEIRKKNGEPPKKDVEESTNPRKGLKVVNKKRESVEEAEDPKVQWTSACFDFSHHGSYDEDILKDSIDKAVTQMGCEWSGHIEFESVSEAYKESKCVEECDDAPKKTYEGLQNFKKNSENKAFYKTFKKLDSALHEGTALTRQESIGLYKAANSALTQLSIELEHNPEFLDTFNECTSILAEDVADVLGSLQRGKSPSKKTMESLAKFSEALLNEAEEDEEDIEAPEDTPVDDEDFVGDDEGEIKSEEEEAYDQDYADARKEAHEKMEAEYEETDDEGVQGKLEQDRVEVAILNGEDPYAEEDEEGEDSEDDSGDEPATPEEETEESEDITDDELSELKKHLKEMRKTKKVTESQKADRGDYIKVINDEEDYASRGLQKDKVYKVKGAENYGVFVDGFKYMILHGDYEIVPK